MADYGYDVNQHRVSKTLADGSIIHYHYDEQGRMMAETDGLTGATIRDYIWFGLSPVAVDSAADGLHYIHTDHLGRPAFVTDPSGTSVWDGGITTPFGYSLGVVGTFTQKLMFPGQYRDEETGYDQNWNRTYDPELGRYLQSDPIGLAGGLNRYAYVGGNPVSYIDPTGEIAFLAVPLVAILVRRFVAGAVLPAVIDIVSQAFILQRAGCLSIRNFDGKRIFKNALAGGVAGLVKFPGLKFSKSSPSAPNFAKGFISDRRMMKQIYGTSKNSNQFKMEIKDFIDSSAKGFLASRVFDYKINPDPFRAPCVCQ
ncbi:RHS repeat domain-containing protein [Litorimonas sp. WD9-15]|uniref:RHS repeat domain-containing protein n=1 Tax=Litorimonas sp. WD9-15 TaxID=3418716 RepID=UPI003CFCB481